MPTTMQITVQRRDGREETIDLPAVPRKGDEVVLDGATTTVSKVVWRAGRQPTIWTRG